MLFFKTVVYDLTAGTFILFSIYLCYRPTFLFPKNKKVCF